MNQSFICLSISVYIYVYSVQMGEPPEVKVAANLFREMCYDYRDQLSAGIIIGGWDKKNGGKVGN